MIGQPKTRLDIQKETGLRGKELTSHLRNLCQQGGVIRNRVFKNPAQNSKRITVYQTVPVNIPLELDAAC